MSRMLLAANRMKLIALLVAVVKLGTPAAFASETTISAVERSLGRYLEALGFSDTLAAIERGDPIVGDNSSLAAVILRRPAWITDEEGEILIEMALRRGSASGSDAGSSDGAVALLIHTFASLRTHSLRALVLERAMGSDNPELAAALFDSARLLARLLVESDGNVPGPYEIEAVALARAAPRYPDVELAGLLTTIATYSMNRNVVQAARSAVRSILSELDRDLQP